MQSSMIAVLSISTLKVLWFIEFSLYMAQRKIFLKFLSQHFSWKKSPFFSTDHSQHYTKQVHSEFKLRKNYESKTCNTYIFY